MSSRVQKGSTVFRPVVKGRGRPASTTPAAEARPSSGPNISGHASIHQATAAEPVRSSTLDAVTAQAPAAEGLSAQSLLRPPLPTPPTTQPTTGTRLPGTPIGTPLAVGQTRSVPVHPLRQASTPVIIAPTPIPSSRNVAQSGERIVTTVGSNVPQTARNLQTEQPVSTTVPPNIAHRLQVQPMNQAPSVVDAAAYPEDFSSHSNLTPSLSHQFLPSDAQMSFPSFPDSMLSPSGPTVNPALSYTSLSPLPTQSDHAPYGSSPFYPHLAFGPQDVTQQPGPSHSIPTAESKPEHASKQRKRGANKGRTRAGEADTTPGGEGTAAGPQKRRGRSSAPRSGNAEIDVDQAPSGKRKRRLRTDTSGLSSGNEASPSTSPNGQRKRRASSSSTGKRGRRKRVPTPLPFDGTAEGEEPDPTATTMADLCEDLGTGRVSSKAAQIVANHATWRTTSRQRREELKAKLEAKKYGREEEDAPAAKDQTDQTEPGLAEEVAGLKAPPADGPSTQDLNGIDDDETHGATSEGEKDGFNYSESVKTSKYNVQVRIGPNGEMIIDEQSLFVDRPDEEAETQEYTHIEESDATKFVNSMSYSRKARGSRWNAEETEMFFSALSQFGENYELISLVLPGRDRKACKMKFKSEDKKNPARITYCLKNRTPYDIDTLSRLTGKDFSGPTPIIKTAAPLTILEPESTDDQQGGKTNTVNPPAKGKRKKSRTPAVPSDGEEILGAADDFIDKDD